MGIKMLPVFMLTRLSGRTLVFVCFVASVAAWGCEKTALLAPTGSSITLNVATNVLPANGSADIIATVLESSGTPPHSGTEVTFTTTLGTIEPARASTDSSGRVAVKLVASNANGGATISALSGGASTGTNRARNSAVGPAG